jgi:hypothetical protein
MRLNQLLEEPLTPGNIHLHVGKEDKHLLERDEYKAIKQVAPDFAKKLLTAWEGDARDYNKLKDAKGFDPLFPKMTTANAVSKFAPDLKDPKLLKGLEMLGRFHSNCFPTKAVAANNDKSVWSHERLVKEGFVFDQADYDMLREELAQII